MTAQMSKKTKTTRAETDGDVSLLKPFLQRKVELRNVEEIPLAAQHNELLSEIVFTVRSENGNDYEATSRPRVWSSSSSERLDQTRLDQTRSHTNFVIRTTLF